MSSPVSTSNRGSVIEYSVTPTPLNANALKATPPTTPTKPSIPPLVSSNIQDLALNEPTLDFLGSLLDCMHCNVNKLSKQQDEISKREGDNMVQFIVKSIQQSDAPWKNDVIKTVAFFSILFASCFRTIKCPLASAKVQSANCMFTEVQGQLVYPDIPQKFFVKLLPKSQFKADDVLVDNVHGFVINSLRKSDPTLAPHLPVFFDSFLTYVDGRQWALCEHMDLSNPKSPFCLTQNTTNNYGVMTKASVSVHVTGKTLAECMDNDYDGMIAKLQTLFPPFWEALQNLVLYHGFIHNDLHQGNIFYDQTRDALMLIDFGRSHFGSMEYGQVAKDIMKVIRHEKAKYAVPNQVDEKYQTFINSRHPYVKSVPLPQTSIFPMGITDLISVALQMTVTAFEDSKNTFLFLDPMIQYSIENNRLLLYIPTETKHIYKNYIKIMKTIENKSNMFLKNITEGMFYATLFIYYTQIVMCKRNRGPSPLAKIDANDFGEDCYRINLDTLFIRPHIFLPNLIVGHVTPLMMQNFFKWIQEDSAKYHAGFLLRRSVQKIVLHYSPFLKKLMSANYQLGGNTVQTEDISKFDDQNFNDFVDQINLDTSTPIQAMNALSNIHFNPYPVHEELVDNSNASVESMMYSVLVPKESKRAKYIAYKQFNMGSVYNSNDDIDNETIVKEWDAEINAYFSNNSIPTLTPITTMPMRQGIQVAGGSKKKPAKKA